MAKLFIGKSKSPTSWQNVSKWYNKTVDKNGSYFHQHIIIPGVLKLLTLGGLGIWALIDLILIITKTLKPKSGKYI